MSVLGLDKAPSAETLEEVVKYLALECKRKEGLKRLNHSFVRHCIAASKQHDVRSCEGFVPLWIDGTLLEVYGKSFNSLKLIDGNRGQLCLGAFVGEWLAGINFEREGEGEESLGRTLLKETMKELVSASKLGKHVSVLLDSLYGDGTTLDMLERLNSKPSYVVGAQGLREAKRGMSELPEAVWRDTVSEESRGWSESGAATAWLSCAGWKRKRQMICRRWKYEGEMIWNYAAVVTNLCEEDRRVRRVMERYDIGFEEAIWFLYSKK